MLLTDDQIHEIREIIRQHHAAVIAGVLGIDALDFNERAALENAGLLHGQEVAIDEAYQLGHMLGALDPDEDVDHDELRRRIENDPIALTDAEQRSVEMARQQAAQYIRNIGLTVETDTARLMTSAEQRDAIRDTVETALERRETIGELKSRLGNMTGDWSRDWTRVASTELQNARLQGTADQLKSDHGTDVYVFKRPAGDACNHCLRLHLGPDGNPRIFRLSTLEDHGTNVGKKSAEWRAVVGPVHPHCACPLIRMPVGWGFNQDGDLAPGGEGGIQYDSEADIERSLRLEDELLKAHEIKGRLHYQGMTIAIENPKGSVRRWKDRHGRVGATKMKWPYGYIEGTKGPDGDQYDCFVGPDPKAPNAWIVHQQDPETGEWDEDKVMLGFRSVHAAKHAYLDHYDDPRFLGSIAVMPMHDFREKVMRTTEPHENGMVKAMFVISLEKARGLPVGTVRAWRGGQYKKVAEGDWRPVGETKTAEKPPTEQKQPAKEESEKPKSTQTIVVYRLEGQQSKGLDDRNAANIEGIIRFMDQQDERQVQAGSRITAYRVKIHGDFSDYTAMGAGSRQGQSSTPHVGRTVEDNPRWRSEWYSFPKGGHWGEAEALGSVSRESLDKIAQDRGEHSFGAMGWVEQKETLERLLGESTSKSDVLTTLTPAGSNIMGQRVMTNGGGGFDLKYGAKRKKKRTPLVVSREDLEPNDRSKTEVRPKSEYEPMSEEPVARPKVLLDPMMIDPDDMERTKQRIRQRSSENEAARPIFRLISRPR